MRTTLNMPQLLTDVSFMSRHWYMNYSGIFTRSEIQISVPHCDPSVMALRILAIDDPEISNIWRNLFTLFYWLQFFNIVPYGTFTLMVAALALQKRITCQVTAIGSIL